MTGCAVFCYYTCWWGTGSGVDGNGGDVYFLVLFHAIFTLDIFLYL